MICVRRQIFWARRDGQRQGAIRIADGTWLMNVLMTVSKVDNLRLMRCFGSGTATQKGRGESTQGLQLYVDVKDKKILPVVPGLNGDFLAAQ